MGHHAISCQKGGIQHRAISIKCMPLHIGDSVVQTDGWSRDYYVTTGTKISWLDRLLILLSNGAPLAR